MMQLFILALILGIVAHDAALFADFRPPFNLADGWLLATWVVIPKIVLACGYALVCGLTKRRLGQPRGIVLLRLLDRFTGAYRTGILTLYATDLALGGLLAVRSVLGNNLIVIDEILFLIAPLLMLTWGWWAYYPIDRRLREVTLIRRLDTNQPIHPVWTRGQYLLSQVRHQIALMLVPLLILLAWGELVQWAIPPSWNSAQPWIQVTGAACVFLFAPLMIRFLWDTTPLPAGELRRRLMAMCQEHRVGVRELLLWRTFGGIINAAVMGLIRPLRYILLTDALLENMPRQQIEAIMAHEIAHVRRHHMFWLLAISALLFMLLAHTWWLVWWLVMMGTGIGAGHAVGPILSGGFGMPAIVGWIVLFGWVSRRFERQADAFAVQHLAHQFAGSQARHEPVHVGEHSVAVMTEALGRVAELNQLSLNRHSWRHGSIAWRQRYLHSLAGATTGRLPIDRQVSWIKVWSILGLAILVAIHVLRQVGTASAVTG